MDKKQFMTLVYEMLNYQQSETTVGDFRRVVKRILEEEE